VYRERMTGPQRCWHCGPVSLCDILPQDMGIICRNRHKKSKNQKNPGQSPGIGNEVLKGPYAAALHQCGGQQGDSLVIAAVHHLEQGAHGLTAHGDLVQTHGGDGGIGVLRDHQIVQAHKGDILRHPQTTGHGIADGVGGVGVTGAEHGGGQLLAGEDLLHGGGGRLGDVVHHLLHPFRAANQSGVMHGILETGKRILVEFLVPVGDQKADVPVTFVGQIADGPIGGIIVIDLQQRNAAVLRRVRVHAQVGELLFLQQADDAFVVHLNENDAVSILAVDGVHQLAAVGIFLQRGEDDAVTPMLALFENAGQHIHGKQVKEAEVVLAHDHMDREAALQVQAAGVDVGGEAGLPDDLLHLFAGGVGYTGTVIEDKGHGSGGYFRHAGNVSDGQLFHAGSLQSEKVLLN